MLENHLHKYTLIFSIKVSHVGNLKLCVLYKKCIPLKNPVTTLTLTLRLTQIITQTIHPSAATVIR